MIIIDKLCYSSKLRYKSPYLKFAFAITALIICVSCRSLVLSALILGVMSFGTVVLGGIKLARYSRFMAIPLTFLILSSIAIAVNLSPEPLSSVYISIGSKFLTFSNEGLFLVTKLIIIALASVACLYFLTLTTPIPDILTVLGRIHCPKLLIELMLLIYRFIFILLDMAYQLRISQICRLGNRSLKTSIEAIGSLMAVILVKAMKRANTIYDAMESRCYDGTITVLTENQRAKAIEIFGYCAFSLILTSIAIFCCWKGI